MFSYYFYVHTHTHMRARAHTHTKSTAKSVAATLMVTPVGLAGTLSVKGKSFLDRNGTLQEG